VAGETVRDLDHSMRKRQPNAITAFWLHQTYYRIITIERTCLQCYSLRTFPIFRFPLPQSSTQVT